MTLVTTSHPREGFGYRYIYPVVSRRSQGLSIGVNLSTNNACNWRCIYCQVPGLIRGAAPPADLLVLAAELDDFLAKVQAGWMEAHVPPGLRRLNDIAFSGNGEPTTCPNFSAAVACVGRVLAGRKLLPAVRIVVITNGSQIQRKEVLTGLTELARHAGEVWFKLDRASQAGRQAIHDINISDERVTTNLALCAARCRTRIQTIVFGLDGKEPPAEEMSHYLAFLRSVRAQNVPIADVLLYGLERASHQPEAARLHKLPAAWLESFAEKVRAEGYLVHVHP